jgi:hypothetical protein
MHLLTTRDAVLIIDPLTNTTDITALNGLGSAPYKWNGIAYADSVGKLFAAPYNANAVLMIDPLTCFIACCEVCSAENKINTNHTPVLVRLLHPHDRHKRYAALSTQVTCLHFLQYQTSPPGRSDSAAAEVFPCALMSSAALLGVAEGEVSSGCVPRTT